MLTYEELYLSYNYDYLLNLVDSLREKSIYAPFLDLEFKSADFIHTITDHITFIELIDDEDINEYNDENEYGET
tara:strand:- start:4863 stop:5084 length:222 start_codon:yes stop_codon:yes gene_type:complete